MERWDEVTVLLFWGGMEQWNEVMTPRDEVIVLLRGGDGAVGRGVMELWKEVTMPRDEVIVLCVGGGCSGNRRWQQAGVGSAAG
eukprot:366455-Chlamydomonas_euryale.AAC.5